MIADSGECWPDSVQCWAGYRRLGRVFVIYSWPAWASWGATSTGISPVVGPGLGLDPERLRRLVGSERERVLSRVLWGRLAESADVRASHREVGLSTEEVHKRSSDGIEFANRAAKCFEEAGYEEGSQIVTELIQSIYDRAIQIYCKTNEPDQIYYTLAADNPLEDASKCIKEWKIPMPSAGKSEAFAGGDGFLHVFDPHPPPSV